MDRPRAERESGWAINHMLFISNWGDPGSRFIKSQAHIHKLHWIARESGEPVDIEQFSLCMCANICDQMNKNHLF